MKKVVSNIGLTILVILMLAAVGAFLAPRFGWQVDTVLSGSMEPNLKVGGVVVTQPVGAEDIREGDVITFYSPLNGELVTHRVVAVEDAGFTSNPGVAMAAGEASVYFRTKGDANEDADPFLVPAENVVGRVVFHLPYLGYAASFIQTKLGLLLTLFVPGLIIIIMELRNIWHVLNEKEGALREEEES